MPNGYEYLPNRMSKISFNVENYVLPTSSEDVIIIGKPVISYDIAVTRCGNDITVGLQNVKVIKGIVYMPLFEPEFKATCHVVEPENINIFVRSDIIKFDEPIAAEGHFKNNNELTIEFYGS